LAATDRDIFYQKIFSSPYRNRLHVPQGRRSMAAIASGPAGGESAKWGGLKPAQEYYNIADNR
jgi:hypothetical protein